jgi:UDP-N-acetylmuramate--alanine ligase
MPIELVGIGEGFTWSITPTGIENGCHIGEVKYNGEPICTIKPGIPGRHNLMNATMAVAACHAYGVDAQKAADAITEFRGVDRRMMEVGEFNGAKVVDDYGHHPTEIRATLGAIRERYQPKRLVCVFQPHQHSRTRFLLEDFAKSFSAADETLMPDSYFVRDSESEKQRVSSRDLVQRITECGQQAQHIPQFDAIVQYLRANLRGGDLVVTMGAGNVWEIGRDLVNGNETADKHG